MTLMTQIAPEKKKRRPRNAGKEERGPTRVLRSVALVAVCGALAMGAAGALFCVPEGLVFPLRLPEAEARFLGAFGAGSEFSASHAVDEKALADAAGRLIDQWNAEKAPLRDPLCQARLRWAGSPGSRTPFSIVYLHGFSASPLDLHPAFDLISDALDANLVQVLMTGHCSAGDSLSVATATDWLVDVARGWALGAALGERVVLAGMSTGASLALLSALHPPSELAAVPLHSLVLLSPNFGIANPAAHVLGWPGGVWLAGLVKGSLRNSWEAETPLRQVLWTTSYHLNAAAQVQVIVDALGSAKLESIATPALVVHAREDRVIDLGALKRQSQRLGSGLKLMELPGSERHELAGDAINPGLTNVLADSVVSFLREHAPAGGLP